VIADVREVGMRLEAQASGVVDGPKDQVPGELQRHLQDVLVLEEPAAELNQLGIRLRFSP